MKNSHRKHQKALYFLSAIAIALSILRVLTTGHVSMFFLAWNLFLAWIPYWIGQYAFRTVTTLNFRTLLVLGAWLAFLPNAPYLITDFVHFNRTGSMKWLDILLFSTYAITGVLLFYKSVAQFREVYLKQQPAWIRHGFIMAVLSSSAYGIYVGRIMRYNSWDVLTDPFDLSKAIFHSLFHFEHLKHTLALTLLFMVFLYFSILIFDHLMSPAHEEEN